MARTGRHPLAWLGGLLVVYLTVPVVAFLDRLATSHQRGFSTPGLWSALRTSAESATIATVVVAALGIPLAFALARSSGVVSRLVGALVVLPLALPPVMAGILLIYLIGPYTTIGRWFGGRLVGSVAGIVLAQVFVSAPFLVIAARSAFASMDPSLDDLAATLGHRPLARFLRVALPVAAPAIRAGLLLTWLRAIGEYGANVIVAYHPYTLPVFTYVQFSGAGLPSTQAPTALVLAAAAAAVMVTGFRRPPRLRGRPDPWPPARPPASAPPVAVGFDLDVRADQFQLRLAHRARSHRLAILGPSGSGKSLTLKALAGLLGPAAGEVLYGDEQVGSLPAEQRGVGYVPQGQALFPNLPVRRQVTFAVNADRARAAWWFEALGLNGLEDRRPAELSGGQRQRVSLAAALSRAPRLVLLDEPFSALDSPVREALRRQLRALQRDVGLSTVLVTHDAEEAAYLADEVVVISSGRVLQAGPTEEVYSRPASPEVARLLGIENVLAGTAAAGGVGIDELLLAADCDGIESGAPVMWSVRPEDVEVSADGGHPAVVADRAGLGAVVVFTVALPGGLELRARTPSRSAPALQPGDRCGVDIDPGRISVWSRPPAADSPHSSPRWRSGAGRS